MGKESTKYLIKSMKRSSRGEDKIKQTKIFR